jgi:hypothetical protein
MLRVFLQQHPQDLTSECLEYLAAILRTHIFIRHLRLGGPTLYAAPLAAMLPVTHTVHISLEHPPSMADLLVSIGDGVREIAFDIDCSLPDRVQALFDALDHLQAHPASRRSLQQIVVALADIKSENDMVSNAFLGKLRASAIGLKAVGIDLLQDDGMAIAGGPARVGAQSGLDVQPADDDVASKPCVRERLGGSLGPSEPKLKAA